MRRLINGWMLAAVAHSGLAKLGQAAPLFPSRPRFDIQERLDWRGSTALLATRPQYCGLFNQRPSVFADFTNQTLSWSYQEMMNQTITPRTFYDRAQTFFRLVYDCTAILPRYLHKYAIAHNAFVSGPIPDQSQLQARSTAVEVTDNSAGIVGHQFKNFFSWGPFAVLSGVANSVNFFGAGGPVARLQQDQNTTILSSLPPPEAFLSLTFKAKGDKVGFFSRVAVQVRDISGLRIRVSSDSVTPEEIREMQHVWNATGAQGHLEFYAKPTGHPATMSPEECASTLAQARAGNVMAVGEGTEQHWMSPGYVEDAGKCGVSDFYFDFVEQGNAPDQRAVIVARTAAEQIAAYCKTNPAVANLTACHMAPVLATQFRRLEESIYVSSTSRDEFFYSGLFNPLKWHKAFAYAFQTVWDTDLMQWLQSLTPTPGVVALQTSFTVNALFLTLDYLRRWVLGTFNTLYETFDRHNLRNLHSAKTLGFGMLIATLALSEGALAILNEGNLLFGVKFHPYALAPMVGGLLLALVPSAVIAYRKYKQDKADAARPEGADSDDEDAPERHRPGITAVPNSDFEPAPQAGADQTLLTSRAWLPTQFQGGYFIWQTMSHVGAFFDPRYSKATAAVTYVLLMAGTTLAYGSAKILENGTKAIWSRLGPRCCPTLFQPTAQAQERYTVRDDRPQGWFSCCRH